MISINWGQYKGIQIAIQTMKNSANKMSRNPIAQVSNHLFGQIILYLVEVRGKR